MWAHNIKPSSPQTKHKSSQSTLTAIQFFLVLSSKRLKIIVLRFFSTVQALFRSSIFRVKCELSTAFSSEIQQVWHGYVTETRNFVSFPSLLMVPHEHTISNLHHLKPSIKVHNPWLEHSKASMLGSQNTPCPQNKRKHNGIPWFWSV
jgi:hypothetical protein